MKKIKDLSEDYVIAHFLKGELDYEFEGVRLRDYLMKKNLLSIVENPNILNKDENLSRKKILSYRGYPDSLLFEGFPIDVKWALYEIENKDLNDISFINNDQFWKNITNNTRFIKDTKIDDSNDNRQNKILEILDEISNGNEIPEMILVRDENKLIVFEGHHRAGAYAIASKEKKFKINTIIGTSNNLKGWYFY